MQVSFMVFITVLIIIIIIIVIKISIHLQEKFYGQYGIQPPMNIPIPKDANEHPYGYISYNKDFLDWVCPTKPDTRVKCKTHNDCPGKAELCMNSAGYFAPSNGFEPQPDTNYCVCSITNMCIEEGIC